MPRMCAGSSGGPTMESSLRVQGRMLTPKPSATRSVVMSPECMVSRSGFPARMAASRYRGAGRWRRLAPVAGLGLEQLHDLGPQAGHGHAPDDRAAHGAGGFLLVPGAVVKRKGGARARASTREEFCVASHKSVIAGRGRRCRCRSASGHRRGWGRRRRSRRNRRRRSTPVRPEREGSPAAHAARGRCKARGRKSRGVGPGASAMATTSRAGHLGEFGGQRKVPGREVHVHAIGRKVVAAGVGGGRANEDRLLFGLGVSGWRRRAAW